MKKLRYLYRIPQILSLPLGYAAILLTFIACMLQRLSAKIAGLENSSFDMYVGSNLDIFYN